MNRRILFIIGAAILLIVLVGVLWAWFLSRPTPTPQGGGTFGTAPQGGTTGGVGTGGSGGNIPGTLNQGGTAASGGGTTISGAGNLPSPTVGGAINPGGTITPPSGVQWLGGTGSGGVAGGGGLGGSFNPQAINQLNSGTITGTPTILGNTVGGGGGNNNGLGLEGALIGAGIGTALCTAGLLGGVSAGAVGTGATAGAGVVTSVAAVPVNDISLNLQTSYSNLLKSNDTFKANFLDCITRTIARAALQQITSSVVNWINSGFNGSPSFVTNYQQFFQNVADRAAGEYIKGSALSFLCSPFQLKIRIALAQSYANRNNAASCTLSRAISNVNSFMSGNFSAGGWGGLLEFTTIPTNNPYGAFAFAEVGLQNAQSNASYYANRNISAGGFLSYQEPYDCKVAGPNQDGSAGVKSNCKYRTATPGKVIEDSLSNTLKVSQDTLTQAGVSGSFDAIISALITQLMTRTLYGGLSNLSGQTGYQSNFLTPAEQQAQTQARGVMTQMQADVTVAQQYGQSEQGSIQDIQGTQFKLNDLYNCWNNWTTNGNLSSDKQASTAGLANAASTTIAALDGEIVSYNNNITKANTVITILQGLQTRALTAASLSDVQRLSADYQAAKADGRILTQADVTFSQQQRASLQTRLTSLNGDIARGLAQCHAFGN